MQKYVNNGVFSGHVVLIDEISFLSVDLLAQLEQLRPKGTRLLAFGDFKQLPPVSNRWRSQLTPPGVFEKSRPFYHWSGGTHFAPSEVPSERPGALQQLHAPPRAPAG